MFSNILKFENEFKLVKFNIKHGTGKKFLHKNIEKYYSVQVKLLMTANMLLTEDTQIPHTAYFWNDCL